MRIRTSAAALLVGAALAAACSSSGSKAGANANSDTPGAPVPAPAKKRDPGVGIRVIDAVVVERSDAPSGSGGVGAYSGTGNYYMTFETHEGEATARYHLEVNRTQWFRFQEGAHVRVTLNNNIVQDIRPLD
ncbi:MAG TPA: hypothetical protein VH854_10860 [Thermoanaerobaculia bacterium]|nr:hypothetical protein [Thermoanaerobaculia bacterium]